MSEKAIVLNARGALACVNSRFLSLFDSPVRTFCEEWARRNGCFRRLRQPWLYANFFKYVPWSQRFLLKFLFAKERANRGSLSLSRKKKKNLWDQGINYNVIWPNFKFSWLAGTARRYTCPSPGLRAYLFFLPPKIGENCIHPRRLEECESYPWRISWKASPSKNFISVFILPLKKLSLFITYPWRLPKMAKQKLCMCIIFSTFLCRYSTTTMWKYLANFTFCGRREHKARTFFLVFRTSIESFSNSIPEKTADIRRIERDGIKRD